MSSTSMNIRMDSKTKADAQELFSQFGLDMTTAVNMFLKQSIRERRIPFEIKLEPNRETLEAMNEIKRMKEDASNGKSYSSAAEMMKDILHET